LPGRDWLEADTAITWIGFAVVVLAHLDLHGDHLRIRKAAERIEST
jgi:hypothetical protein